MCNKSSNGKGAKGTRRFHWRRPHRNQTSQHQVVLLSGARTYLEKTVVKAAPDFLRFQK